MAEAISLQAPAAKPVGFFQQEWPSNLILGTFFVLTIPLAFLTWNNGSQPLMWAYIWFFGVTHFVLTFAIYLNSANLRHFVSSRKNLLLFFVIPGALFVGMYLLQVLRVQQLFPVFAVGLGIVIRAADFTHYTRQSFGVLQMFKGFAGWKCPKEWKRLENYHAMSMMLLLLVTFLAGGINPLFQTGGPFTVAEVYTSPSPIVSIEILQYVQIVLLPTSLIIFGILARRLYKAGAEAEVRRFNKPLAYLVLQTFSGMMAAFSTLLYFATLAIHYVEYHVLMVPRCFAIPLDPESSVDRFFARLRSNPYKFYAVVLLCSAVVTTCSYFSGKAMGMVDFSTGEMPRYMFLVSLFDGLFLFHYLVESLIWRFSDPYFRKSMANLYFVPQSAPRQA